MAHHWPAAILAERHGEHIRRISTRVSSAGRGSPRASPASRTTAMAMASAHAAADGSPGTRVAASLRGHVSIRRHWLSDTCTHTNTHKGRRRDESASQRRSPDRGLEAVTHRMLKRRSSGSGAMGSACGGRRSRRRLAGGGGARLPNSLTALSRAYSMGATESRGSSIHPSTPTFLSAHGQTHLLRHTHAHIHAQFVRYASQERL